MTLTDDAIDHWTRIEPAPARGPLLAEMADAAETALDPTISDERRSFYSGLFTGYAVGFGLVSREVLDRARREPRSSATHIDFRRPRFGDDTTTWWACGVRHGYLLSTSEHPYADSCVLCGERLIEDVDDTDCCTDGLFCGWDDHRREWHGHEGQAASCWEGVG